MRRAARFAIALLVLCVPPLFLSAQDFAALLGAGPGARAAALVSAMDASASALAKNRAELRERILKEEALALQAYVLDAASRNGENWALPDGSLKGSLAAEAFASSRARALSLAESLAASTWTGEIKGGKETFVSREAAAARLEAIIEPAFASEKASSGIERLLKPSASLSRLFPEAIELGTALKKAGRPGRALWLAALARRTSPELAERLASSRADIETLLPSSREVLDRLEAALGAYHSLIAAMPMAAFPAELPLSALHKADSLGKAIAALLELLPSRFLSLLTALERGDALEAAAAASVRRLASIFNALPAVGRSTLQRGAFVPPSSLARFAAIAAPLLPAEAGPLKTETGGAKDEPAPGKLESQVLELNRLAARLFSPPGGGIGPVGEGSEEPALLLLERPDLAGLALGEERYARLAGDARTRIARLYHAADEITRSSLAREPRLLKAAAKALGAKASAVGIEAVEITLPEGELGRRLAIVMKASADSGASVYLPVPVEISGPAYAAAFAKAAALDPKAAGGPLALFALYRQAILSALPLDDGGDFVLAAMPREPGGSSHDYAEAETRLLEGWKP